ncbi:unnamed protein product [Prorocentrum cordatum]|uniref:Uncharacterized protein n=1 Tax=Prorocentrum cordatum TaxID=2364126 RepID=A0ABN9TKC2_9DINO|nr:unnamed protein product [Polarella glacialis]
MLLLKMLTRAVCLHKLDWKRDSLEFMCVDGLATENIDTLAVGAAGRNGTPVVFRRVFEMVVLGNLVDIKGSARRSLDHRFLKAEGCYWASWSIVLHNTVLLTQAIMSNEATANVGALLWSSGECPSLYELAPRVPAELAPGVARALRRSPHDPSSSPTACESAAGPELAAAVGRLADPRTGPRRYGRPLRSWSRTAPSWCAARPPCRRCGRWRAHPSHVPGPVRGGLDGQAPAQEVLTPGALARELDRYCGRGGARAGRRGEEGGGPAEGEDQLHITTDLNQLFAMPPSGYAQPDSQLTAASAARAPAEA